MAWKQVKVKIGKHNINARMEDNILEVDNVADPGESIKVDGKDFGILGSKPILRGDMLEITLAVASSNNKEKSDDGNNDKST